jgi:iron complex outermembrane receptor protein
VTALGADYGVTPSHSLLNLDLAWNSIFGSRVDLTAFATNVTNRKYYQFIPGLAENAGIEFATLGEPRIYGARIRMRFGT